MLVEKVFYLCPVCHRRGQIDEILVRPEKFLILKGRCEFCDTLSGYKTIDLAEIAEQQRVEEANGTLVNLPEM
jgi:hypothetical protein